MKIGELLVSNKMITATQLQQALKAQQIYGGKLGTNLVELGLLTETQLTYFLAKQLNIQAAEPSDFGNIQPSILAMIPREFASKYRLIPLGLLNNKLKVAFADPMDTEAREKIAFRSGHPIIPLVAPELLINYGLEKYYGIVHEKRYLKLDESDDENESSLANLIISTAEITSTGYEFNNDSTQSKPTAAVVNEYNMEHLCQDLFQATSKDTVFRALSRYFERSFASLAIFVIRYQNEIWGWSQSGMKIEPRELRKKQLASQDESAIADVFRHKDVILNAILSPLDEKIINQLGGRTNHTYHLFPIILGGKTAACFLVCSGDKNAVKQAKPFDTDQIQLALAKGSLALQMVAIRRKIVESTN